MVPFNFPKEEEIQGCTVSWQNYGYILQEEKGIVLMNLLPRGITVNSKHYIETLRSLSAHVCCVCPQEKCLKFCLFMTMLGCTQVCIPQRP